MRRLIGRLSISAAAWLALAGFPLQAAAADDSDRGRLLAASCAGCHGTNGQAQAGGFVLAGINRASFVATMKAFKSGQRPATVMHQIAKGYGDAEIELLANYFSSQRPGGGS